jgi:2,3-bisphosphoglycerate-independent phosphoglycerate mutase
MNPEGMANGSRLVDDLAFRTESKILLAVIDGLGDLPIDDLDGRTPLEAAATPNLDALARLSSLGQHVPVARGITPGSGPAHLALFGYDPLEHCVGRGVLSALGVGFDLHPGDLAARINFCTVDGDGTVTDRRAGRISTETCRELVDELSGIEIDGIELHIMPVRDHRACVVFRGDGLSDSLTDTDPGLVGRKPLQAVAGNQGAERTAAFVREFSAKAARVLEEKSPANQILLRGFALYCPWQTMEDRFGLRAAAVALYPMYRGVASLVGMDVIAPSQDDLQGEAIAVRNSISDGYTFTFMHHKPADSAGEDGDCRAKIAAIEEFDTIVPALIKAGPDVLCITGDHSTPCSMKLHSWHPVPLLLYGGPQRTGCSAVFSERSALSGSTGTIRAVELMAILMASAGKLAKYGA